jgi:acetylornithine deacetylase/succinyl-diaminopimelate desuccinylase-like protein
LLDTAVKLIDVPSPTGSAGACADRLAAILESDGFRAGRFKAGHPAAPAVVAWLDSGRPGPVLQFDGHLDVVHLPYVAPTVANGRLLGSGACDMKAGVAAAVEALRALRDAEALTAGAVLFTAHDQHEAPWGYGQQLDALIRAGIHGDAVLIPEYQRDYLPTVGRGAAVWKARFQRPGQPVHEVMRPDEPGVIAAAAEFVSVLEDFARGLDGRRDEQAGAESAFVGQLHSGEIYNQYPQVAWLEGTRRWLPGRDRGEVEKEFRALLDGVAVRRGLEAACEYTVIRDAFRLNESHPFVQTFQRVFAAIEGAPLPTGPKRFVDDGNSFSGLAGLPAITHGPRGGGAHTVAEWVEVADLARVASLYARTAVAFCGSV